MQADNACTDCNGTEYMHGSGDIGDGKCSACGGTGIMDTIDALAPALGGGDQSCQTCNGSKDCQSCNGSGTI